jgi:hypothetical protein
VRHKFCGRLLDGVVVIALIVVAVVATGSAWSGAVSWTTDGCFYEAQALHLRGMPSETAREMVFRSPSFCGSTSERAREAAAGVVATPTWTRYSAQFYRRRLLVPAVAAAVHPVFHNRSLEIVGLLGYVAAAVVLYALLRLRFDQGLTFVATTAAILIPQYRVTMMLPLTDSWGVALETVCLLCGFLYLRDGSRRLLAAWLLAICTLAFVRDNTPVAVVAIPAAAGAPKRKLAAFLGGTVAAVIPSLAFGLHYKVLLAYTLNRSQIPPSTSWTWSLHHYLPRVVAMLRSWVTPIRHGIPPVTALALLLGLVGLVVFRQQLGTLGRLALGSVLGSALLLLSLPQEGFRIAFVVLPAVAVGYAGILERLAVGLEPSATATSSSG